VAVSSPLHVLSCARFQRARQCEHALAGASMCRRSERATRMNLYSHGRRNRQRS